MARSQNKEDPNKEDPCTHQTLVEKLATCTLLDALNIAILHTSTTALSRDMRNAPALSAPHKGVAWTRQIKGPLGPPQPVWRVEKPGCGNVPPAGMADGKREWVEG